MSYFNNLETLEKNYQQLTDIEQHIIKVGAIIYEATPVNTFWKALQLFRVRKKVGDITQSGVKRYKSKFHDLGLFYGGNKVQVVENFVHILFAEALKEDYFNELVKFLLEKHAITLGWYYDRNNTFDRYIRDMRIAVATNNLSLLQERSTAAFNRYKREYQDFYFWQTLFNSPFRLDIWKAYPVEIQDDIIWQLVIEGFNKLSSLDTILKHAQENDLFKNKELDTAEELRDTVVYGLIMKGEFDVAEQICKTYSTDEDTFANLAWIELLRGNYDKALQQFDVALQLYRKQTRKRAGFLTHVSSVFYLMLWIRTGKVIQDKEVVKWAKKSEGFAYKNEALRSLAFMRKNDEGGAQSILRYFPIRDNLDFLLKMWCEYWIDVKSSVKIKDLKDKFKKAYDNAYYWYALEVATMLEIKTTGKDKKNYREKKEELEAKIGAKSVLNVIEKEAKWKRTLNALTALVRTDSKARKSSESRLIWLVDIKTESLEPKEQTITKSGRWSKGRKVSLKRIKLGEIAGMTAQDLRVAKKAISGYHDYYSNNYYIDFYTAIAEMIDHPLLFLANSPTTSLELIKVEPNLLVKRTNNNKYSIEFSENLGGSGDIKIIKETNTRYKVLVLNEEQKAIQEVLGNGKFVVPSSGKNALLETIKQISSLVTIESEVGAEAENIPMVDADKRLYIQIIPMGDGFKLETFSKPFTTAPPYFKNGQGSKTVIAEIDGEKVQTKRNLKEEKQNEETLIQACPTLWELDGEYGEWMLEEPDVCLEALSEIEPLRDADRIVLEWPKGAKMQLLHNNASFEQLFLNINGENDWFELSGSLKVDEHTVVQLQTLLQKLDDKKSRFIELSEGNFIALTKQLRRKLQTLKGFVNDTKTGLQFHKLKGLALEEFLAEAKEVEADKEWQKYKKRIDKARKRKARVPSTLKAELRDYQKLGYQWLSQLAEWGVGACLADDMGLGKTIQALTVILERAKTGPTLVVAPASVTRNWIKEAQKFAPTLNAQLFGQGKRADVLKNLKKFDLLVTSYGLMQQEIVLMEKVKWTTIVLDEAQSIKNKMTKRSKAAMKLQSKFKVITTGTPIENHLGELWNLFYFINPGLLGTFKDFNDRFAYPIEKMNDKDRKKQLQKLIQPFILRRRKTEVLDELPSKTEITLTVEMSQEEMAFYEAARRNALEHLENTQQPPGARHLQILTEIMRLRQVCCNTRLVVPESTIPSSKLELFARIVGELLENGHKALVFSQFVKHLKIIEEYVQQQKISYQYLDGSTPMKKRQKSIDAFQSGEGDLFLISLKAGGLGLNLTAADYVIHMDPWWNPAVEDQASDRAHRIGQKRPVTVYRLVTEGTIEEKIVQLHEKKRDLADSLLGNTDVSAKLSSDQLLEMIKEG